MLCGHNPLTGADHRDKKISAPPGAILVVDSVFAFRPEYNDCWECRIWLDVDPETALCRGIARDSTAEGAEKAGRLDRDRYHAAEMIYLAEVDRRPLADVIVDNRDFKRRRILTHRNI